MISSLIFVFLLAAAVTLFVINVKKVSRNINLGKPADRSDRIPERWKTMIMVALGQSKMVTRPVAGIMHIFVYVGFVLINIEVMEMMIDGIFGTHRFFSFLGPFYDFLIGFFEILAFLVTFGCAVFLIRRNLIKVKRFLSKELDGWPRSDANIILISEILMMTALFLMNAADLTLQQFQYEGMQHAGAFPISRGLTFIFGSMDMPTVHVVAEICWWFHIVGIFAFLNYLPYSKHFHIVLAFPNVFFSNLDPKGKFTNLASVTREVKLMLDPSATPPAADAPPERFGAKDVTDLNWKQLLDAYSCTECGRCTSACPQNMTGKLLSPRKIMMDTRDRLEETGKNMDANNGEFKDDGKKLVGDYITAEELWACNTCNACVQECPVNIDPLSIIMDLRRYLVMEENAAPGGLNMMSANIENNGAPWQFSPADRANWKDEN